MTTTTSHAPFERNHARMPSLRTRLLALAVAAATPLALAACGSSGNNASGGSGTHVTVRTDVFYTGAVLPLVAGVAKGIYAEHGLDISLNPGKGSATTIQTVAAGSDDIGYADAGTLVQAVAKGVPDEMIAGMVQRSPLAVFVRANSGISSPAQLAGKTGGFTAASAPEMLFPAFAKATGLDANSVHRIQSNIPTRDTLFVTGKTQFTFGLVNVTKANLEAKCHCSLDEFSYADAGIQALSSGLITSKSYAAGHAKVLREFLAATADAVTYVNAHLDDAVSAFFSFDKNSTLTPAVVKAQWLASESLLHSSATKSEPFGCTSASDWTSTIDLMQRYANVPAGKVSPAQIASNQFLPGSCPGTLG